MIMGSFFSLTLMSANLQVEFRQPVDEEKAAEIVTWLESTADTMKLAYGRFPNPNARIIVVPSAENAWGHDSPVIYGRISRDNGEAVELFIDPDRPIEEFYSDWVATHEFSHLMLPLLRQRYRWISEGFASYYQNILMARANRYSAEYAWRQLSEGFERGRASRPDYSPNDAAAAGIRHARMKVYWSGAAIALMADVTLRRQSNGQESLDTVLDQFQACCLPSQRRWSGPELFRKLDSFTSAPVFMPLYSRYANRAGFPDVAPLLEDLGVATHADGRIRFSQDSDLAEYRRALMTYRPER